MKTSRKQLESRVMELSATLPTLRPSDAEWIDTNFRNKWKNVCLCYYVILERKAEWQVVRWYYKTTARQFECMQIWLNETSEVVLAKHRYNTYDGWKESDPMTPKRISERACYSYLGDVRYCPASESKIRSLLPIFKRNGLKTSLHGFSPYALLTSLLRNPRIETLWKLHQFHLVDYFYGRDFPIPNDLWQSIRVALRHGYRFKSYRHVKDWTDMLRMMKKYGGDTHNPTLICPANFKAAHDHWVMIERNRLNREQEMYRQQRREAQTSMVADYEPIFKATREQFLDMVLTDGKIVIKAIPTAKDIVEEGKAMHHCVGGYYNRTESLILSATINGKRIETIEVSLTNYTLVQSRGLQNKYTKYHDRIVELVNKNLQLIRVLDINHKDIEKKILNQLKKAS